jgi:uncharacterized membrane protein YdjX (TVP38/TMEM64 family)
MNLRRLVPRLALALLLVALAAAAALNRERLDPAVLDAWIGGLGSWAPIGYVAVYALATIAFVPGTIFGLAGGAVFGPVWGTVFNLLGATCGATRLPSSWPATSPPTGSPARPAGGSAA